MKHTPGPWEYRRAKDNHWIYASGGRVIAFIGGKDSIFTTHKDTPHEANAHLIAAFPELLEACKGLLKHLEDEFLAPDYRDRPEDYPTTMRFIDEVEKAVSKAEGNQTP